MFAAAICPGLLGAKPDNTDSGVTSSATVNSENVAIPDDAISVAKDFSCVLPYWIKGDPTAKVTLTCTLDEALATLSWVSSNEDFTCEGRLLYIASLQTSTCM